MIRTALAAAALSVGAVAIQPAVAGAMIPNYRLDPNCNEWCAWVWEAYGAEETGRLSDIVWAAARAYGRPDLTDWMHALIRCENGGDYYDHAGYYVGATQQDPYYFPARAARAGFPGKPATDPVANIFTAMQMRIVDGPQHWPNCP